MGKRELIRARIDALIAELAVLRLELESTPVWTQPYIPWGTPWQVPQPWPEEWKVTFTTSANRAGG